MIGNRAFTLGEAKPPFVQTGQELAVRSVYTQRDDSAKLTTDRVVLPNFTCAIPKEVLFQVLDKLCKTAKTNAVIKQMLDNFVRKLIAGNYSIQSKGENPNYASEQGDFFRLILTHDIVTYRLRDGTLPSYSYLGVLFLSATQVRGREYTKRRHSLSLIYSKTHVLPGSR